MNTAIRSPFFTQDILARTLSYWNWKCALLSSTARSIVYLVALAHTGHRGGFSIVMVEMVYVTLTAGFYAGLQQKALGLRNLLLGNLIVVIGVPSLSQLLDWNTHRLVGAAVPGKATLTVCIFVIVSALFHLHVMRRGAFLTNHRGRSLIEDFRRMPGIIAGFVVAPVVYLSALATRLDSEVESEALL
jgi:hypothetical protein